MSLSTTTDWRASQQQTPPSSKRLQGAFLLALTVFLLVLLGLWLWPTPAAKTHIIRCRVEAYDPFDLPPLYYVEQDQEKFGKTLSFSSRPEALQLTLGEQIGNLGAEIEKALLEDPDREKDVLIVDLACHAATFEGKAYLLGSQFDNDFTANEGYNGEEVVPLTRLLDVVKVLPFRHKLIILDCSRMTSDPWLGSLVDEFPWLLEEATKKLDNGENLWVVTATGPHQTARVSHVLGRSVFGLALEDALSVSANANTDQDLTFREFYEHLHDTSQQWSAGRQTPQLFRGGKGLCRAKDIEDFVVARLAPTTSDEENAETMDKEDADPAVAASNGSPGLNLVVMNNEQETSDGEEQDAPTEDPLSTTIEKPAPVALEDYLWSLRDALMPTENEVSITALPLDCAPQLWRRVNLGLVRLDQAAYSEALSLPTYEPFKGDIRLAYKEFTKRCREDEFTSILRELSGQLDRLSKNESRRLKEQEVWRQDHPVVLQRRLLLQKFCQAIFSIHDYIQWYDRASQLTKTDDGDIDSYLTRLQTIKEQFNQPAESQSLAGLEQEIQELRNLEDQLYLALKNRLEKAKTRLSEESRLGNWSYVSEQQLQDLMAVPLLRATERTLARTAIIEARSAFQAAEKREFKPLEEDPPAANNGWEIANKRAKLYAKLVGVTNSQGKAGIEALLEEFGSARRNDRVANGAQDMATDVSSREVFRKIGELLHEHYKRLAKSAENLTNVAPSPDSFLRNLEARLADGRDFSEKQSSLGLPKPEYLSGTIASEATISLDQKYLQIDSSHPGSLKVTVKAGGDTLKQINGIVKCNHLDLKVTLDDGRSQRVFKGNKFKFEIPYEPKKRSNHSFNLTFSIDEEFGDKLSTQPNEVTLTISDQNSFKLAEKLIKIYDLQASEFQLVAAHRVLNQGKVVWKDIQVEEDSPHQMHLKAFPNRGNVYSFGVKNNTPIAKKIQVRLHAVPQRNARQIALIQGGVFEPSHPEPPHEYLTWLEELERQENPGSIIASTQELVELDGNSDVHWLKLASGTPAPNDNSEKAASPSAEGTPPPELPLHLPKGLLLEIRDVTAGVEDAPTTFHWIEFSPKDPWDYVQAEVELRERIAKVSLGFQEGSLPHNISSLPVKVQWHEMPGSVGEFGLVEPPMVELARPSGDKQINVPLANAQGRLPSLVFGAENFPYVFRFEGRGSNGYQRNTTRRTVRITDLRKALVEDSQEDSEEASATPRGTRDNPYLFAERSQLEAVLEVEVPINWRGDLDDYVRLERIQRNSKTGKVVAQAYSQVSYQAQLLEIEPRVARGEVVVRLDIAPLKMRAFTKDDGDFYGELKASIFYQGVAVGETSSVFFAVDTKVPTWNDIRFISQSIYQGERAELLIDYYDGPVGTGVSRVQYYWDDGSDSLSKEEKKGIPKVSLGRRRRLSIETKGLRAREHVLAVNLIDKAGNESGWIRNQQPKENSPRISLIVSPKRTPIKKPKKKPAKVVLGLQVKLFYATGKPLLAGEAKGITVKLKNGKRLKHVGGNKFEIKGLSAGSYEVEASGTLTGNTRVAKAEDVAAVPIGKLAANAIELRLDKPK